MTTLQTHGSPPASIFDERAQRFDPGYFLGIFKSRLLYFAIPYLLVLVAGAIVIELQRPIYRSEGKILVESPEIPPDLVRPTITEVAYERVQVIQQRIMARDNLMAVVNKYSLFPRERDSMSGTELLELIRSRTEIKPVELSAQSSARPANPTIAFTLSFEYEDPTSAMKVANEFLTTILREDASARNKDAAGTTQFLDREVKRIEGEHDAVVAQIVTLRKRPPKARSAARAADRTPAEPDELKQQKRTLSTLEAELAQKSSIYSDEHPVLKNLRRNIASLKQLIAAAPKTASSSEKPASNDSRPDDQDRAEEGSSSTDPDALLLLRQEANLQKALEEAHRKLTAARLGETMERNQQGERLQVIEQPSLPQKPVRPKKLKLLALALGLAAFAGAATVFLVEALDGSIRGSRDLAAIVDRDLLVTIPYLSSPEENRRAWRLMIATCASVLVISAATLGAAAMSSISIGLSEFARPLIDSSGAKK